MTSRIQNVSRRFRSRLKYHGAGSAIQFLLLSALRKVATFERVHILAMTTAPDAPDISGRTTRFATREELHTLAGDKEWDFGDTSQTDMDVLLQKGHRCVLNIIDEAIAGYAWMNPHRMVVVSLGVEIELTEDEVHIYKGFTHPEFRGQRLGADRYAHWFANVETTNGLRILADYAFDNPATMARVGRLGLVKVGTGTRYGIGSSIRHHFSGDLRKRAIAETDALAHRDH